jgi:hypothetical protein
MMRRAATAHRKLSAARQPGNFTAPAPCGFFCRFRFDTRNQTRPLNGLPARAASDVEDMTVPFEAGRLERFERVTADVGKPFDEAAGICAVRAAMSPVADIKGL